MRPRRQPRSWHGTCFRTGRGRSYTMRTAAADRIEQTPTGTLCIETTLLDLVRAVSETTEDDGEVVTTIIHMLRAGNVRLTGSFKGEPTDQF